MPLIDLSNNNNLIIESLASESGQGLYVKINNVRINGRDPQKEAKLLANNTELRDNTLYLLFHPLHFYGVDQVLIKLPNNCLIVALEPNVKLQALWSSDGSILKTIQDSRLVINLDNPAKFSETKTLELVRNLLENSGTIRRVEPLFLNSCSKIKCVEREQVITKCQDLLRNYWRNQSTLLFMGRLWIKNIINNFGTVFTTKANSPVSLPARKACLVCGAGPSLDSSLDFIRDQRQHLFIITADSALPSLLAAKIDPDVVVVLEAQQANVTDFVASSEASFEVWCDLSSHYNLLHQFKGRTIRWFLSEFAPSNLWSQIKSCGLEINYIPALGSVGVVALYLAEKAGYKDIAFTGLDFSYYGAKSHAASSPHHLYNLSKNYRAYSGFYPLPNQDLIPVDGYKNLLTDKVILSYATVAEKVIEQLVMQGLLVYDLRTSGIQLATRPLGQTEAFIHKLSQLTPQLPSLSFLELETQAIAVREFFAVLSTAIAALEGILTGALESKIQPSEHELVLQNYRYFFYVIAGFDPKNIKLALLPYLLHELHHFKKTLKKYSQV